MKLKNQLLQAVPQLGKPYIIRALEDLALRPIRPRAGFALRQLIRAIYQQAEDLESERQRLLSIHAERDDTGEMIFADEEKTRYRVRDSYRDAYSELMEIVFDCPGIKLSEIESIGTIQPMLLLDLSPILIDDYGVQQRKKASITNAAIQVRDGSGRPDFIVALEYLVRQTMNFSLAVNLYRTITQINERSAKIESERIALAEQHARRDETGAICYRNPEKTILDVDDTFQPEYTALMLKTFDVPAISLSELDALENMPAKIILDLGDLIYDESVKVADGEKPTAIDQRGNKKKKLPKGSVRV